MNRYDMVIVGGGMAGLSAALYGGWLGRSVLLIERAVMGGQIINADRIENFPGFPDGILGPELVTQTRLQAVKFGANAVYGEVSSIQPEGESWVVQAGDEGHEAKTVIVASGGKRRTLGLKGEKEFEGKGLSHCATCDGAFFAGQPVAVVGGGDTALDEGLVLTQVVSKVTVVHRLSTLDASRTLMDRAKENPKMDFLLDSELEEISGRDVVENVQVRNLKIQSSLPLPVSGIFICTGFEADTGILKGLVDLDPQGHVAVDVNLNTSAPGIFAAGYARQGSAGQLASVAGDGVTAAVAAHRYIEARERGAS
jgi:thioredoxin reductase (NADPH)